MRNYFNDSSGVANCLKFDNNSFLYKDELDFNRIFLHKPPTIINNKQKLSKKEMYQTRYKLDFKRPPNELVNKSTKVIKHNDYDCSCYKCFKDEIQNPKNNMRKTSSLSCLVQKINEEKQIFSNLKSVGCTRKSDKTIKNKSNQHCQTKKIDKKNNISSSSHTSQNSLINCIKNIKVNNINSNDESDNDNKTNCEKLMYNKSKHNEKNKSVKESSKPIIKSKYIQNESKTSTPLFQIKTINPKPKYKPIDSEDEDSVKIDDRKVGTQIITKKKNKTTTKTSSKAYFIENLNSDDDEHYNINNELNKIQYKLKESSRKSCERNICNHIRLVCEKCIRNNYSNNLENYKLYHFDLNDDNHCL